MGGSAPGAGPGLEQVQAYFIKQFNKKSQANTTDLSKPNRPKQAMADKPVYVKLEAALSRQALIGGSPKQTRPQRRTIISEGKATAARFPTAMFQELTPAGSNLECSEVQPCRMQGCRFQPVMFQGLTPVRLQGCRLQPGVFQGSRPSLA